MKIKTILFIVAIFSITLVENTNIEFSNDIKDHPHFNSLLLQIKSMLKQDKPHTGFAEVMGIIQSLIDNTNKEMKKYDDLINQITNECEISNKFMEENLKNADTEKKSAQNKLLEVREAITKVEDAVNKEKKSLEELQKKLTTAQDNFKNYKKIYQETLALCDKILENLKALSSALLNISFLPKFATVSTDQSAYNDAYKALKKNIEDLLKVEGNGLKKSEVDNLINRLDRNAIIKIQIGGPSEEQVIDTLNKLIKAAKDHYQSNNNNSDFTKQEQDIQESIKSKNAEIEQLSNQKKEGERLEDENKKLAQLKDQVATESLALKNANEKSCDTRIKNEEDNRDVYKKDQQFFKKIQNFFTENYEKLTEEIKKKYH